MRARLDDSLNIVENPALFGGNRQPGLVSVSANRKGELFAYRRSGEEMTKESVTFQPFLWLSEPDVLRGLTDVEWTTTPLEGSNYYRLLLKTNSWSDLKKISDHIAKVSGTYANHPQSPQLFLNDAQTQYLLSSGLTYFNSMAIEEVTTLFLKVYTAGQVAQEEEENKERDPQRIVGVALKFGLDGPLHLLEGDEDQILWRLTGNIKKLDPDVLCGHNLFKGDLETIALRAKALKVRLDWGRDGERLSGRRARMQVAEKQIDYQRYTVPGRELCDSWLLSILYDVSGREMTGYDLEDVAQHFSLPFGRRNQPLEMRATQDVDALAKLYRSLIYPYFLQAQIFPLTFEGVVLRGNATRINHLFLREYFRQSHSVPAKPEVVPFAGGLTAQEHEGCAYGVYHCDVASLYPSLIIAFDLDPDGDELHIFKGLLTELREFRFLAKSQQKSAKTEEEALFYGGLQTTFKILINSFYGYLGFGQGHFADFEKAAEVTRLGREMLAKMMDWLKAKGARVLEVDTDGIYFVPSSEFATPAWIEALNEQLPSGVNVEFDGRYRGMYCHKMKNYALLEENGSLILRGSGLRSRATEPFLRQFIEDLIRVALSDEGEPLDSVFTAYETKLKNKGFEVDEVSKTDTLIDSPATYAKKIEKGARNRAAVYEIALAAPREFHAGESLSYYVTGEKATVTVYDHCKRVEDFSAESPDINIKYYLKKLKATYKKFQPILSREPLRSEIPFENLPAATH